MIPLQPGIHDVSYGELREMGGVPTLPKRPFIRKLRRDDGHWTSSDWIMFMLYPWILSDERDGKDLTAFRTWEAAYAKAYEMVTAVPQPIDFAKLRERFNSDAMYRLFGAYGVVMPAGTRLITYTCDCGHIPGVHDYGSNGLRRNGCAVCDCKKSRGYVRYEIDKRT